jgi:hypothetical protein
MLPECKIAFDVFDEDGDGIVNTPRFPLSFYFILPRTHSLSPLFLSFFFPPSLSFLALFAFESPQDQDLKVHQGGLGPS